MAAWVSSTWVSLSPDARYSLAWGAQLARGDAPELDVGQVSTPHPLPIALGGLASLLGARAAADLAAFGAVLSFALLLYAAFRLGRALGGPVAGAVALALVATRPRVDFFASRAFIDVPFAALVLLAAALAAEAPHRNATRALWLLAAAGLLRPEAWGLGALYAAWLVLVERRWSSLVLAAAAPVLWLLFDLALTGDALHSLHGTQDNTLLLQRATGLDDLLPRLHDAVEALVGIAPAAAGAAFGLFGLVRFGARRDAFAVAAVLAGAGFAAFALLAAADLPLNDRYLVVPALALLALGAAAVPRLAAGWKAAAAPRAARAVTRGLPLDSLAALAAAAVLLVPTALTLPDDLDEARAAVEGAESKARADEDLERLLDRDDVLAEIESCPTLLASSSARASVAALLEIDPADVTIARRPVPPPGAVALSTSDTAPPGTPRSVTVGAWTFVTRC